MYSEKDIRVRDHCRVVSKCRGSARQICNVNYRLMQIIPVIFHKLMGYGSHHIMQEIGKFDQKINFVPNGMEKCMAYILGENLVFIDSMQFMNHDLDNLLKSISEVKFKYLSQKFDGKNRISKTKRNRTIPIS